MRQHGLTIVVPILKGHEEELRTLLNRIGTDIDENGLIDFYSLSRVHFMRWVILPGQTVRNKEISAQLALSTNYDGKENDHLKEFAQVGELAISKIYQHCKGFPSQAGTKEVVEFLRKHKVRNAAFYVGSVGRTVKQVKEENKFRYGIKEYLQASNPTQNWGGRTGEEIRQEITVSVAGKKEFASVKDKYPYPFLYRFGLPLMIAGAVVCVALVVLGLIFADVPTIISLDILVALGVFWFVFLRFRENKDKIAFKPSPRDPERLAELNDREDFRIQNQITHLVEIKPGWFRQRTLRFVLGAINLLARTCYNRGNLGGIPSIHFARWAIIDGGRRLLFFSNFDGSWESYLGEFIDRASAGLTGVWSNTEGFPPTRKLIYDGAKNSADFKAWVRSKQIETQVWYSAYKTSTVQNINNNTEIRKGLTKKMKRDKVIDWLERLN